ncbi:MAG: hypothetical protein WAP11_07215, partial [Acetomicrobium sp.]
KFYATCCIKFKLLIYSFKIAIWLFAERSISMMSRENIKTKICKKGMQKVNVASMRLSSWKLFLMKGG